MSSQSHLSPTYPAELVASVPHLVGYHPMDSLVLVTTEDEGSDRWGTVIRIALPSQADETYAIDELTRIVGHCGAVEASLVVVAESYLDQPPKALPYAKFVERVATALTDLGVLVNCQVWAAVTRKGAPWCLYGDPSRRGTVPDPNMTTIAAEVALAGGVTYDSRDELFKLIAPDVPREVLNRRASLLLVDAPARTPDEHVLDVAIGRFEQGEFELADPDFATLGTLLSDPLLRDQWVARCAGDHGAAAEHLVLRMVRGLPEPWRAHAAAVYAFSVYLRGQGAMAGIAATYALDANPDHNLANLLKAALRMGMHPDDLRSALDCVTE